MSQNFTEEDCNLHNEISKPIRFMYSDFTNEPKKIIISDLLHPKKRNYEKCSYLIFLGYFPENPQQIFLFNFPKATFLKHLTGKFCIQKYPLNAIIKIQCEIKRNSRALQINNLSILTSKDNDI
jgi:hypothetical protein